MLASHIRIKHVARLERDKVIDAVHAVVHVHHAIHHGEYFLPIVDVPDVRLIGPVKANAGA